MYSYFTHILKEIENMPVISIKLIKNSWSGIGDGDIKYELAQYIYAYNLDENIIYKMFWIHCKQYKDPYDIKIIHLLR